MAKKSAKTALLSPSNTRTRGPPPVSVPVIRSARPSAFRSTAATSTPPVKSAS